MDLWELERQNLLIYDDKKLGAGAFGAVYLGRLIGLTKKNKKFPYSISLIRAKNCNVAIKMLPGLIKNVC